MQKVIVIVGPTASGKSAFAVELARAIDGEIISADSRQVYKGLDIGTGKVTKREMKGVPHHLLDVASPKRVFTADHFVTMGRRAIEDILRRKKTPIVCGGTGFYIDTLLGRISFPNVPPHKKLRTQLAKKTPAQLYALLKSIDPRRAKTIEKENPVRLIRAIEIAKALGRVPKLQSQQFLHDVRWIGIRPDMQGLRKKIHVRLFKRMKKGLVAEAEELHLHGLSYKRMTELGLEYRYLAFYLQKKISKKEMIDQLSTKIWQYARRQIIYWKRNDAIQWYTPAELKRKKATIVRSLKS